MINCFHSKKIKNIYKGSYTTKLILKKFNKIIDSLTDLYIIDLGTNDIRYRDSFICAMNPIVNIYIKLIKL